MFLTKYRKPILTVASVVLFIGAGMGVMYYANGLDQGNARIKDIITALVMLGFGIYFLSLRLKLK